MNLQFVITNHGKYLKIAMLMPVMTGITYDGEYYR